MKTQFWMSKWFVLIFASVLIGFGIQGTSYGQKAIVVENEQCSGTRRAWPLETWVDVTIRGTVRATRDVTNLQIEGSANGSFVGFTLLGNLSAGQSKDFSLTGFIVTNENSVKCSLEADWLEFGHPDTPRRTPDPPRPAPDPPSPDVVVEASKSNLVPGESFTLTTIFKNSSTRRSSPRTLRYYRSAQNDRKLDIAVGTDVMESIDPGGTSRKEIVLTPPEIPGTYYYGACIGTTCGIGIGITVVAQLPDLATESPRSSMYSLAPGKSFTLTVPVRNNGNGQSPPTTLRYYRAPSSSFTPGNTEEIGTAGVDSLDPNVTDDVRIVLTAPEALGTYYYRACIDSVPNESHTNNNCSTAVNITVHSAPKALVISSGNDQNGTPNSELTAPLVVRVLDDDGNGVANVRITFRVSTGQGRLTSRGNRRTVSVTTDSKGLAEVPFTPTSAGPITVEASVAGIDPVVFTVNAGPSPAKLLTVSGDTQSGQPGTRLANPFVVEVQDKDGTPIERITVTFRVTAGGGNLSATTVTTGANGQARTLLTLGSQRTVNTVSASVTGLDPVIFSTSIEAIVLIAADQRPPMYWVDADAGTLHRLVGAKVENLLPSVQNATSLTVDAAGGKLYWTEKTGERTGRIRRANLDGSNVQLVKDLTSAPLYLALDTANGKLYLINAWNKIQRMNRNGSGFQPNLITDLQAPIGLTVDAAGGKVYWIEQTGERAGRIRSANLDGSNVQLVKNLTSASRGFAADTTNGKLYLSNAWGKLQRMNFNGSKFEPNFITGLEAPGELAVDAAGGKVYWAEAGSLRRANLTGGNIQDVVQGLGAPGRVVLGITPVPRTTAAASDPSQPQTPVVSSPQLSVVSEDTNDDGVVDVQDLVFVAHRYGQTGTTTADVNGDGVVNSDDLILVAAAIDADAAAAPSLYSDALEGLTVADVKLWLSQARQRSLTDPSVRRGVLFLEQLLASLIPKETSLSANYPNPFNPETWIPYQLSKPAEVSLTIYDIHGHVVRALDLGHQTAGTYQSRSRAAFWDGRNEYGEPVASGLYFYTLTTGDFTATRKMLIRK